MGIPEAATAAYDGAPGAEGDGGGGGEDVGGGSGGVAVGVGVAVDGGVIGGGTGFFQTTTGYVAVVAGDDISHVGVHAPVGVLTSIGEHAGVHVMVGDGDGGEEGRRGDVGEST